MHIPYFMAGLICILRVPLGRLPGKETFQDVPKRKHAFQGI